ncbi:MAG: hypothetical protein QOJ64_2981 [Acidobacteriota bacterium]|nr:hypothetical protein [Acidobacteriota bacterium]
MARAGGRGRRQEQAAGRRIKRLYQNQIRLGCLRIARLLPLRPAPCPCVLRPASCPLRPCLLSSVVLDAGGQHVVHDSKGQPFRHFRDLQVLELGR